MKTGAIEPNKSRWWFITRARCDKCTCSFGGDELYHLQYSTLPNMDITISNSNGDRLAYIKNRAGIKAWLTQECSIHEVQTDQEIARFTVNTYKSLSGNSNIEIPIISHTRGFKVFYESSLFKASTGPLDTSVVHIDIFAENETVPITLMCFAQYAIPV